MPPTHWPLSWASILYMLTLLQHCHHLSALESFPFTVLKGIQAYALAHSQPSKR